MIIFLYGSDIYRSRQKLKEIVAHYKKIHKKGLSFKILDSKEKSFQDFDLELRSVSMFQEKKLLILKNAFFNPDFKTKFLKRKKDYQKSQDILLFYEENIPTERDPLFKFLKQFGKTQKFELLKGQKLKNWVKKEFGKYKTEIEQKALEKLIDYIGSDLWRMSQEIKKLVSFRNKKEIKIPDIELLVRSKIETNIFKTIDAIAQKNKKLALKLLHEHLEKGDSPLYLLSMINFQFRNLLIVKELIERHEPYNTILRKSGLHPFVVKKSYFQSQKFNLQELKKIFQKIFQVDLNIKTGRIDPQIALDLLIAEI